MFPYHASIILSSSLTSTDQLKNAANDIEKNASRPLAFNWDSLIRYLNTSIPTLINVGIKVIVALLVFFIGRKIIHVLQKPIHRMIGKTRIEEGIRQFIEQIIRFVLYLILVIVILSVFGIKSSALAAIVAAVGLSAGLAMQGSLSNFAGGLLILVLKPFKVGDYIQEDTHGNAGIVTDIQLCYTRLRTSDGKVIVLPNGSLSNSSLTNYSSNNQIAVTQNILIPYSADFKEVRDRIRDIVENDPARIPETDVSVFINQLADTGIELAYRVIVSVDDYWNTSSRLNEAVRNMMIDMNLTIPKPQMEVIIDGKKQL